jgi:GR25 family glycosyltransferase involved in LPS biosynthesis
MEWLFLTEFNIDVWCICLKERDDRFDYIKGVFDNVGLRNVCFYRPSRNLDGAVGCMTSHKYCAEESSKNNRHALVFEDDTMFTDDYKTKIQYIVKFLKDVSEWDVIRLGSAITSVHEPSLVSAIWKCNCYNTHAIIYNYNSVDNIFKPSNFVKNSHIDDYLHDANYNDFSLLDPMCYQKGMGTDINWFNNKLVQNIMQSEIVFDRLQRYNNVEMRYIRFLPICIQEKLSLWSICINIGFFTKWLY